MRSRCRPATRCRRSRIRTDRPIQSGVILGESNDRGARHRDARDRTGAGGSGPTSVSGFEYPRQLGGQEGLPPQRATTCHTESKIRGAIDVSPVGVVARRPAYRRHRPDVLAREEGVRVGGMRPVVALLAPGRTVEQVEHWCRGVSVGWGLHQ